MGKGNPLHLDCIDRCYLESSFMPESYIHQVLRVTFKVQRHCPHHEFHPHLLHNTCLKLVASPHHRLMLSCYCALILSDLTESLLKSLTSLSCRRELSYFGVKVAIIEPGFFQTAISSSDSHVSHNKMLWDQASTEVKEIYGEKFLQSCE